MEPIERINSLLKLKYGEEYNQVRWRVVRAGDQTEKRWMTHDDKGNELIHREVRLVRKYQHIEPHLYVLEKLTGVEGETDLVTKLSYEPMWTFIDDNGKALHPSFDACQLVADSVYQLMGHRGGFAKYKDGENREAIEARIDKVEKELFGNETAVGDALAHKYGVAGFHPKG